MSPPWHNFYGTAYPILTEQVFNFGDVTAMNPLPNPKLQKFSIFSCQNSILFYFTFRSTIHFELVFMKGISLNSFFFMWKSNCSRTICWKDYPCSIIYCLCSLSKISWLYLWGPIYGLCIMFYWCIFCSFINPTPPWLL